MKKNTWGFESSYNNDVELEVNLHDDEHIRFEIKSDHGDNVYLDKDGVKRLIKKLKKDLDCMRMFYETENYP